MVYLITKIVLLATSLVTLLGSIPERLETPGAPAVESRIQPQLSQIPSVSQNAKPAETTNSNMI